MNKLIPFLSLISVVSSLGATQVANPIEMFAIEPLNMKGKGSRIALELNSGVESGASVSIYLVNDKYPSGVLLFTDKTTNRKKTFSFEYLNNYTRSKNSIKVVLKQSDKTTEITHDTYLAKAKNFVLSSLNNSFVATQPTLFYSKGTWSTKAAKYSFSNFNDIYIPSYYHSVEVDEYAIESSDYFPVTGKDINLWLTNRNGVFNDMPNDSEYLILPLILDENGKLKVKDTYYVDPLTLLMSSTQKEGYIPTKHLYLPKNEMRFQGEYEGILMFNDMGPEHISCIYSFTLNALLNVMGNCHNSEFCVVQNQKGMNLQ